MEGQNHMVEKLAMNRRFQRWVNEPTPGLEAFWADWMSGQPEKKQAVEEARKLVLSMHFADDLTDAEIAKEWTVLQNRMHTVEQEPQISRPLVSIWNDPVYWRGAAVFMGLLVSVGLLFTFLKGTPQREFVTGNGEIKTVNLPDGSVAVLNANSRIAFPEHWEGDEPRKVQLSGEAYFEVTHQANHQQFVVQTDDDFTVEVLGTTFTVLGRNDRNRVVLNSGKVRLETGLKGKDAAMVLKPGDLVESYSGNILKKRVNPESYLAFKDRKLFFDNTRLSEIALLLQDTYGLQVKIHDAKIAGKEFTGTFPMDNLDLLLQALSRTYQLEIRREGNQLLFSPENSTP